MLATIRARPQGISQSALYRAHRDLEKREFETLLEALEMQRLIHAFQAQTGKPGRQPVVYFPGPPKDTA